jgi:crotonobetainyl-CoA:carnitine CoA-transferase CaiB-like acyl-CoA transferase
VRGLGIPEVGSDPRFLANGDRVVRRAELRPILASRFRNRSTAHWLAALDAADVPAAPVNDVDAAFSSPQAVARAMTVEMEHPAFGTLRQVGLPFAFSATPGSLRTPPPLLGEHTEQVLGGCGFTPSEIAELRRTDVV